jgi:hypothetical protein
MTDTTSHVQAALAVTLRKQQQVIARQQALAGGMTRDMLKHRVRADGPWQRLLPGVYLALTGTPTPDQQEMAALLYAGTGSVITGPAALDRQGVRAGGTGIVDVLIPVTRKRSSVSFARIHRTARMPGQVVVIGARDYAMVARAVADAARVTEDLRGVRALVASAVQARRCPLNLLIRELREGPWRGSAPLRRALAEVADGIRSAAEADLRDVIRKAGLPVPSSRRAFTSVRAPSLPVLTPGGPTLASPPRSTPANGIFRPTTGNARWPATPR